MSMKIKRHIPNFIEGTERSIHVVNNIQEFEDIYWIKHMKWVPNFVKFCYSESIKEVTDVDGPELLMAMLNWDDARKGYKTWYVLGYISEGSGKDIGLTQCRKGESDFFVEVN